MVKTNIIVGGRIWVGLCRLNSVNMIMEDICVRRVGNPLKDIVSIVHSMVSWEPSCQKKRSSRKMRQRLVHVSWDSEITTGPWEFLPWFAQILSVSLGLSILDSCQPDPRGRYTKRYQKYTSSGFCYYIKFFDDTIFEYQREWRGGCGKGIRRDY